MRELGDESKAEHERIIELIEQHDLQGYSVGEEFGKVSSDKILQHFDSVEDALTHLKEHDLNDSLVLLKGSRGIQLEKLAEAL